MGSQRREAKGLRKATKLCTNVAPGLYLMLQQEAVMRALVSFCFCIMWGNAKGGLRSIGRGGCKDLDAENRGSI